MAAACNFENTLREMQWYALQVQSRMASTASAVLRGKGYEEFLPRYRSFRRWSDRVKQLDLPLFPGYLFCRFDPRVRLVPVLTTPGVLAIVGAGRTPIPIAEEEIDAVRRIVASDFNVQPWVSVGVGSKIYVAHGPLSGLEGTIVNDDKTCRLVVTVTLLQRSVAVDIDRHWARPISSAIAPAK